jgi:DNA polymerase
MYALDQYINDTGVMIDIDFAQAAIDLAERRKPLIMEEMRDITGLSNPNSPAQLLGWLQERGYPFNDLRSDTANKVIREAGDLGLEPVVAEVLEMRLNSAKSSLAKYGTMMAAAGTDGRFRYSLQFAGASRTNRWAGRRIQTQNLPRTPKLIEAEEDLAIVNKMIHDRDLDALTLYVGEPMSALVGCIRSAFIPTPEHKFIVADLSSIESVVIGWLTNCKWFMDTLAAKHDLYRSFAAHWLNLPYEETKPHRSKAKPATLGAGYRLGGGHMDEQGKKTGLWGYAENMGVHMTQAEAEASVQAFRELCPEIVQSWYDLENAVFKVIRSKQPVTWGCLVIEYTKPFLTIRLPSGRKMYYFRPRIVERQMTVQKGPKKGQKYTKSNFQYEGKVDGANKWGKIYSHGGKLVENIVQALARDVLAEGLKKAHRMGFRIVMHIHDEIVTEVPKDSELTVDDLITCMAAPLSWAPGLPLGAAGWEGYFYRKD